MSSELWIPGPEGRLQAQQHLVAERRGVMLVCHPHPLYGGSMQNKVVMALARAGMDAGLEVLRFNFRGVGASDGQYAQGLGEVEDLAAVQAWLGSQWSGPCVVAGFSFGAYVVWQWLAQQSVAVSAAVLVAPPVDMFEFTPQAMVLPWWLGIAQQDEVVSVPALEGWAAAQSLSPDVWRSPASHMFHGQLTGLRQALGPWLLSSSVVG